MNAWPTSLMLALLASGTLHATACTFGERRLELRDGTELATTEMGDGATLLVLHGGPSLGHRYLTQAFEPLSSDYSIVLYDQRGTGRSGPEETMDFGLDRLIEDVTEAMDAAEADRVVLVGHSWGAYLAMSYAIRHADRLAGLVLVSPTEPGSRFSALQTEELEARTTFEDSVELASIFQSNAFEEGSAEAMDELFRTMYRPWFGRRDDAAALRAGLTREEVERARETGARVSSPGTGATWSTLGRIRTSTLVLHGADDVVPVEMARALADSIPGARIDVLEGVGHFPMLEEPGRFVERLRTFLTALEW